MNPVQIYGIAAGGIFLILFFASTVGRLLPRLSLFVSRHLTYPYFIGRHQLIGPWSRADVIIQVAYLAINLFCLCFRLVSVRDASHRAGNLALVNAIPLFGGPHFGFLADVFGVPLGTVHRIHRSTGLAVFSFAGLHVLIEQIKNPTYALQHLYSVIAGSSVGLIALFSIPVLRWPAYEIFLRMHQALAAVWIYCTWQHLPSRDVLPRLYVYISSALFMSAFLLQAVSILWRNAFFRGGHARAVATKSHKMVKITVSLGRPVQIEPGQYIELWIPTISFWSFLQSHPFMVASWVRGKQNTLELLVEPRRGLTKKLMRRVEIDERMSIATSHLAIFSGPHGAAVPIEHYESIIMVASGSGMAALLPHLKHLVDKYSCRRVYVRRIRVVWQVQQIETALTFEESLNEALREDSGDKILITSIYSSVLSKEKASFGRRGTVYRGCANIKEIFQTEIGIREAGYRDLETATTESQAGRMLVIVSGTNKHRDELRALVREHLHNNVELLESKYQPAE